MGCSPDVYGLAETSGKGRMRTAGLIVAAGRGQRLGDATPKQYLALGGETVLARAVAALLAHAGRRLGPRRHPPRRPRALRGRRRPSRRPAPRAAGRRRRPPRRQRPRRSRGARRRRAGPGPHPRRGPALRAGGGHRCGPRRPRRGPGGLPRPARRRRALARGRRDRRHSGAARRVVAGADAPGLPLRRDPRRAPRPPRREPGRGSRRRRGGDRRRPRGPHRPGRRGRLQDHHRRRPQRARGP